MCTVHAWQGSKSVYYYSVVNYGEPFVSKWRYKIPCVGVPNWKDKLTRCVNFINSILSTLSGRDRLDVFYQLDFIDFIW